MSPERHPIPRDRATAPSPTHTAALVIPGSRTGVAAKLGERVFSKLPSRRRQVITTFPFGSAVERSILDKQSVSSIPPLCFFAFFLLFFPVVREFKSPCLLYIFIFLCCTAIRTSTAVVLLYTHGGFCLLYTSPSPRD